MIFIGIDPGVKGGIAAFNNSTNKLKVYPMPIIGDKEYDIQEITSILQKENSLDNFAIIERQHCMPGEGLSRTFKTGFGYGILLGVLTALKIPFQIVAAKDWQKHIFQGMSPTEDTKVKSAVAATRIFPSFDFRRTEKSRKISDGLTDAACIARYARDRHLNINEGVGQTGCTVHRILKENPHVCVECGDIIK